MPVRSTSFDIQVRVHRSAAELIHAIKHTSVVGEREREANIWLPHALKSRHVENSSSYASTSSSASTSSQFWISSWTSRRSASSSGGSELDFILSCTKSHLGNYPIFLYSHVPSYHLTPAFLSLRVQPLVDQLATMVSSSRVFSVFGPSPLVKCFSALWSKRTSVMQEPDPFYAARFTVCTRETLRIQSNTSSRPLDLPDGHYMRLAEPNDAELAAKLCQEFAIDSVYFPLDYGKALQEAREMIRNRQLWVYYITGDCGQQILASIVGCTRTSESVAAITKVYTNPMCRSRGYAERLVRRVCQFWLYEAGRSSVVLFVAHDNPAAEKVYHRVGFVGLCGHHDDRADDWLEVGFVGTDRGHW
ncbi:hypothetical protein FRC02_005928 [Tulasnella sp. 418]|nr:hypothetical protein FRC02_005928 [Tulasnella sp. 418]